MVWYLLFDSTLFWKIVFKVSLDVNQLCKPLDVNLIFLQKSNNIQLFLLRNWPHSASQPLYTHPKPSIASIQHHPQKISLQTHQNWQSFTHRRLLQKCSKNWVYQGNLSSSLLSQVWTRVVRLGQRGMHLHSSSFQMGQFLKIDRIYSSSCSTPKLTDSNIDSVFWVTVSQEMKFEENKISLNEWNHSPKNNSFRMRPNESNQGCGTYALMPWPICATF